jgi:hypothetical protein
LGSFYRTAKKLLTEHKSAQQCCTSTTNLAEKYLRIREAFLFAGRNLGVEAGYAQKSIATSSDSVAASIT